MSDELGVLQEEFPAFRIWREDISGRTRYIARSQHAGLNPHTLVTADPDELRGALGPRDTGPASFSPQTPNVARVYHYLLQGKDHYAADRAAAVQILRDFPEVTQIARANREFLAQAVHLAAAQGICQFIDLGAGLPISPNTHETAREIVPHARVAYVDHDPVVLAHARAILAVDDQIAVVAGDLSDPASVFADSGLTSVIDLASPVCVLLVSVLHFLPARRADAAVAVIRQQLAPGSCLVISAGTSTGTDPTLIRALQAAYAGIAPVTGRTETEIAAWFDGLALASPGLTDIWAWLPGSPHYAAAAPEARARFLAGVACKPASTPSEDDAVCWVPGQ
jgi:O-methyltransferase involved in polyketide biosynthesis